jgi:hypothetical protein
MFDRRSFLKFISVIPFLSLPKAVEAQQKPIEPRRIQLAEFFIAGFQYHRGMNSSVFSTLKSGEELRLVREPENSHDELAVALYNRFGEKLGYLPRSLNTIPAAIADQQIPLVAAISGITPEAPPWERVAVTIWQVV